MCRFPCPAIETVAVQSHAVKRALFLNSASNDSTTDMFYWLSVRFFNCCCTWLTVRYTPCIPWCGRWWAVIFQHCMHILFYKRLQHMSLRGRSFMLCWGLIVLIFSICILANFLAAYAGVTRLMATMLCSSSKWIITLCHLGGTAWYVSNFFNRRLTDGFPTVGVIPWNHFLRLSQVDVYHVVHGKLASISSFLDKVQLVRATSVV